jgi:hypothetical protein
LCFVGFLEKIAEKLKIFVLAMEATTSGENEKFDGFEEGASIGFS